MLARWLFLMPTLGVALPLRLGEFEISPLRYGKALYCQFVILVIPIS